MADAQWKVEGDYFETCNCDFLCPCLPSNMIEAPTHGECKVAMVFRIAEGHFGAVPLGGLSFVVAAHTPGPMGEGNWTVGLVVDERASEAQREGIVAIASGKAGGPMAALGPLIGTFAGVEVKPIRFENDGLDYKASVPGLLEQGVTGLPSAADPAEPIAIDRTAHPANDRLALAKATHSHLHAFGIDWDDEGGGNNGHFAPFAWRST